MAAPSNAYYIPTLNCFNTILVNHQRAIPTDNDYILKQRFFLDDFILTIDINGNKGYTGIVYPASANYFMHIPARRGNGRHKADGVMLNDAGLNTLGLPFHLSNEGNAVNYISFTVGILQPWYGSVSSCEIEFWAGGSLVTSVTLDLGNPIPNYDFTNIFDIYSPALDISRARAYKVLLMPALDINALNTMSYELRYKLGDETGYKQYLKTVNFPLSLPVSVLTLKKRPIATCDTSGEIDTALFTKIEKVKLLPQQPEPDRIIYREPNGQYVWCSEDINDYYTVFYSDTALSVRANGFYYGGWNYEMVEIVNGILGQRVNCTPAPVLPPRDIARYSIGIDRVDVISNGKTANVYYTIYRDISNGGDSSDVGIEFKLDDGHATSLSLEFLASGQTSVSGIVNHTIGKANDFNGITGSIQSLDWTVQ